MKAKFLFFFFLTGLLLNAQSVEFLPKPIEVKSEYRAQYRAELKAATQEYNQAMQTNDFAVDVIERVEVPALRGEQFKLQVFADNLNDSDGRLFHCPDEVYKRIENECTHDVVVCIDDTKAFEKHPAFKMSWFLPASNYTTENNNLYNDHGTHVAGIVVQVVKPLLDAGRVKLKSNYMLTSKGAGNFSWVAQGLQSERTQEVERRKKGVPTVHNMSFGGTVPVVSLVDAQLKQSVDAGTYFVCAAGNTGGYTQSYPASSIYTIATASISTTGQVSSFSTKGGFVDMAAVGERVRSTTPDGSTKVFNGTSMASPFLTAAATVALSKWGIDLLPNQDALKAYLASIAFDLSPEGKDDFTGWGTAFIVSILDTKPGGDTEPEEPENPTTDIYTINMTTHNNIMRWSPGTTIGGDMNTTNISDIECECTLEAESPYHARTKCEGVIRFFFNNSGLLGIQSHDEATKWSRDFLQNYTQRVGVGVVVNRIRGVGDINEDYIHYQGAIGQGIMSTEAVKCVDILKP